MRPLSSIPRYTAAWSAKGRHCCRRRVATAARPGPFSFVWHIALYVAQMAMDNCQWKLYDQKTIGTACLVRLWQWSLDGRLTQRIALFASVPGSRLYPAHIVVYTESKFRSAGPLFRTEWHCQSLKRPWALHKYVRINLWFALTRIDCSHAYRGCHSKLKVACQMKRPVPSPT